MKCEIRKESQTRIRSYKLELVCECGGKMFYRTMSSGNDEVNMSVVCDKCQKMSTVEIKFNKYGTLGEGKS